MATPIQTWLSFALQQMAAEAYLDQFLSGPRSLVEVLTNGNNNEDIIPVDQFTGKTRFVDLTGVPNATQTTGSTQAFVARYQIVDHHANDATGFSATLIFETQTQTHTLSFRSTEFLHQVDGGDRERDGFGADLEITSKGFALAQLAAMEGYYQSLKTSGMLPTGAVLNITGYSLGGHLATVFTELHTNEVNHAYTFNGAGRGHITGTGATEAERMQGMLDLLRQVLFNPAAGLPHVSDAESNPRYLAAASLAGQIFAPFTSETTLGSAGNIYTDARYRWAVEVATTVYDTDGAQTSPGEVGTSPAFAKITQLYGLATTGDLTVVANSGVHAAAIPLFIEGQPLVAGLPFPDLVESGNTHSITLIVDSLATQELIQHIDPLYGQASAELLIKASSNSKADTIAPLNTLDVVEGDSLEKTVDAFRKLFLGPNLPAPNPLPVDSSVGGFGNLANRNDMYTAMAAIQQAVQAKQAQGVMFTINDLTSPTVSSPAIAGIADTDTDQGFAYRYALKELNPFAIMANTLQANDALYQPHNIQSQLDRFNVADGTGTLTTQYLTDRALFLKEKIALNQLDHATSSGNIHFKDFAPNGLEITTVVDLRVDQEFLFGSDGDEGIGVLVGNSKVDHLYGGGGNDLLEGGEGRDYLQGDAGIDRLDGGIGADTMVGGADSDFYIVDNLGDQVIEGLNNGTDRVESSENFTLGANVEHLTLTGTADLNGIGNALNNDITGNSGVNRLDGKGGTDHLVGGLGNDILIGGTGDNDLLEGGAGFDTYYHNNGDGIDQIEDSDAKGQIIFNGHRLLGGIHAPNDPLNTYTSLDGLTTYVLSGTDLIVNGVLTVNENFQSGQFGIELIDLSSYPKDTGVPTGPFTLVFTGGPESNIFIQSPSIAGPVAAFGNGGNDLVVSGGSLSGGNLANGGPGDDMVVSGSALQDYVIGGDGDDYLYMNSSGDVALGGNGNDVVYHLSIGDFTTVTKLHGQVYADGGAGDDLLLGGLDGDVLHGGADDDTLRGENIPAGWLARLSSDTGPWEMVFESQEVFSLTGGADFLDGGSGNDLLVGDGGDDILSGGAGNDRLFGDDEVGYRVQPGNDMLDGGEGDDLLAGGDGADSLSGGTGIDRLFGATGYDVLDGGDDADMLHGGDGADQIFGGAGDDLVFGDGLNNPSALSAVGGADFLDGGAGNDHLEGGIGDDVVFGGAGIDVLFGDEGVDSLFGDEGDDELQGGDGNDLLSGDTGDDRLFGQDGADTLYGDEGNDRLAGNVGNDSLYGGVGNDILEGGKGNDVLGGGAGHDTYNVRLGDGQDTITDTALAGEGNVIQFFSGITLGSLTFIQDQAQQTLTIQVAGGDSIRLLGFDPNTFNYVVNTLDFADGTVVALADQLPLPGGLIEGTDDSNVIRTGSGDDTIFAGVGNDAVNAGAGNDLILGEGGNDFLAGGSGQDTYVFNTGDGSDRLSDTPGEGNRLVFGPGISVSSVTLGLGTGDSLLVRTGVAGDAIQILDNLEGASQPAIDALEFADGTTLSIEELLARGIEITGTAGPDTLTGTNLIDRISGGAGNDFIFGGLGADIVHGDEGSDQLFGGDGDDQLDGGVGTDALNGEAGQDTYVFGRGYGQDILRDSPVEQSGPNRIQLTSGVSPDEVRLQARQSEDGIDVVLTIDETQDELTLLGAADPSLMPISEIRFDDGTIWGPAEIIAHIEGVQLTASAAGSFLEGTEFRDVLIGAQGNDQLDGLGGADRMVGGAGDDMYWVNQSGDAVVEALGEGQDTVLSQIDYTLPDHVENLFLRSTNLPTTDPVRGEGNANDNVLIGNFVDNVLIGGAGNDTFWGGFSLGSDYGPGDDDLYGGTGNDTYFVEGNFNGFDTVHDVALPGEGNRLQFGNSIRPGDVVFLQEGASLRVTNAGGTDGAVLANFDPNGMTGSLVTEVVAFSGGVEDVTGGYETRLLALMNPTVGTDNADTVTGTANADVIKAQGGDDLIAGGMGNDVLLGGAGSDTYVFNQGDGFDLIDDQPSAGDTNIVQFGAGITQEMLSVSYSGTFGMGGLTVRIGTSGDGLHFLGVSADDPYAPHAIDRFQFADGTQLTFAQLFEREVLVQGTGRSDSELFGTFGDDFMRGLSGSETLASQDGNDMLIGGPGNDVLDGGRGSDTYVFNLGDGFDEIRDDFSSFDINRLRFGPGITASDLALFDAGDGFTVNRIVIGTSGDEILLPNFIDAPPALTIAEFADGVTLNLNSLNAANQRTDNQTITGGAGDTVLIGGRGNDTIIAGDGTTTLLGGAGDDRLIGGSGPNMFLGGPGNDFLIGGSGGNTFFLMVGSGLDSIQIPNYLTSIETNAVQFGGAYDTYHPTSGVGSLVIRYGTAGDELHILDFDPNDVFAPPAIQTFRFTDRTLTYGELIALGFDIEGTTGNDVLSGTNTTDRMEGLDGNDTIESGQGVDTLRGGRGSDILRGGSGDDTYLFNIGDEIGTIDDTVLPGEGNRIQFGVGIVQSDLTFTHDQLARTLTIQVGSSGTDQLRLINFDPTGANGSMVVETLAFADGSAENLAALLGGSVNHAPTVAIPLADQTVPEDAPFTVVVPSTTFADEDAGDVLTLSASMANESALPAWLSFNSTTRTFSGTPDDAQVGALALRVIATDTGNLSVSDSFTLTVNNVNEAPTVAAPLANQTAVEDTAFSFVVPGATFTDVDQVYGDTLSYSAGLSGGGSLPAWLSFDPITHTLSGTPLNGDVGTLALMVMATDQGNLSASTGFTLTIQNVNNAPTVVNPLADRTVPEDAPFSFIVPANTFADEDAGDTLTLSASLADGTALPSWLSFDAATRTLSGTPDDAQVGTLNLRVTATDTGNLSVSDSFTLTVNNVNEAPTVAVPLADQQATEDAPFSLVVPIGTFADVDAGDALTHSATLDNGASLPTWLSFNPITRTFGGTPGNTDVGTLALTVTGMDQGRLSASTNFLLAIQNMNDAPTVTVPIADETAAEDSAFTLTSPSTTFANADVIHGDVLTYSATLANGSPLPAWLSFNPTTWTFSGTPGAGDAGILQIAMTAIDTGNLSATDLFTVAVSGPRSQTVIGTAGNDVLTGGRGDDTLTGLAGNDTLQGGQGHDLLDGGTGTDTMQGGTGNDTYIVDVFGDVVTELANEGTDTVQSSRTYTLGVNVENLTLTGTANLNGTGNALDNVLTGNRGINVLTGGAGNDTYIVGAGDSVVESANGGTDTVQSSVTWTLGLNVENLTITGTANINGTGSSANNVLIGNSGNNAFDGGSGNDTVDGGEGNDSLLGGSGNDTLLGGLGNDVLNAGSGNDVLNGGDGIDTLDGGSGDDQLLGGAGNDALTGGSGADQFTGGTGSDALTGGSGNDLYNFSQGDGQDTIIDSDPFPGNQDRALFGVTINPLDLVISRQANDLRLAIHGSSDQMTVQNWYTSSSNRIETIQAGNGQTLLSTQVDQLIQAMAGFTQQTGLTWDQAIDQQPQEVQTVLAASWQ